MRLDFSASCPALEHNLGSHPYYVFVKYVCSGLRDGFNPYFCEWKSKFCQILPFQRYELWTQIRPFCSMSNTFFFSVTLLALYLRTLQLNDISNPKGKLINDYIQIYGFCLKCVKVDKAISFIQELRQACYLSKFDIAPLQWSLLSIFLAKKVYINTRLTMGERSSICIFISLTDTVKMMIKNESLIWAIYCMISYQQSLDSKRRGH